ncbi:MFS transporter [Yoonia sediminilitoris]|nr:MFS transporter [Yoonia sediminilitoris]
MIDSMTTKLFDVLVDDQAADPDLPQKAQDAEAGNFLRHVLSLGASKIADGLIDPKLVLSWLLTHLGAGAFWTGLLVPVRESGALLPQLLTSPVIARAQVRKWFWVGGAFVQGLSAAAIAVAALTLDGAAAGPVIVGLLALLAIARSVCSASYKDILGKTVGKSRRGTATGVASSAAAVGVIAFAALLLTGLGDRFVIVISAIFLAAAFWAMGAVILATLREAGTDAEVADICFVPFGLLRDRPQLTRFIVVRSLLVGTALAPPYLVMLNPDSGFGALGALVLASAAAALVSSYVWGRLSDRSSRRVLQMAGIAGGVALLLVIGLEFAGLIGVPLVLPVLLFGLMISYQGVRNGRSTHLVDMAGPQDRAQYTALSNTIVGLVLMIGGAGFAVLAAISVPLVIGLFAVMCFVAAMIASGLQEVQNG